MTTSPCELQSPYATASPHWLRGALHLHSTASDGVQSPYETLCDYERRGFDFAVLTDHNLVPPGNFGAACQRMLCLPGCEYRARPNEPELGLSGVRCIPPLNVSDEVAMAAVRALDAFVVYNHPNWFFDHWPVQRMLALRTADALEVYNAIIEWLPGCAEAANKWDILLSCGYRIWGVATDDAHKPEHRGRAWVMVNAAPNEQAILAALKAGRFYASTGVQIDVLAMREGVLSVQADNAQLIRFIAERGQVRAETQGTHAQYAVRADDVYVRIELFGAGASKAWTNPVFVESVASRALVEKFRSWFPLEK
ncbi:MAG: CehA/McbA family metallohydrolase [bacterium]|nr:CehA/McbA family metallohydrolase [bacterium]